MEASKTVAYIPAEIINEILPRLPVQSLLRFKCVCKSWFSSISCSKLAKTNLKFSRNSPNYVNHNLILASDNIKVRHAAPSFSGSLLSVIDSTTPLNPKPLIFEGSPLLEHQIFGHCNGLLCVCVDTTLLLYNPSTRKSKKLPPSGTTPFKKHRDYGICYNESIDDYKVVELSSAKYSENNEVNIYSLRTNSWRKICDDLRFYAPLVPRLYDCGGVLYSIMDFCTREIVAIDTLTYTYTILMAPDSRYDSRYALTRWNIMDFGGCLGVYRDVIGVGGLGHGCDIWTMKESWTKILSVPYCERPGCNRWEPVALKDGILLLRNHIPDFVVYNSMLNSVTYRGIPNLKLNCYVSYPVYIESLVEPSFDGE